MVRVEVEKTQRLQFQVRPAPRMLPAALVTVRGGADGVAGAGDGGVA